MNSDTIKKIRRTANWGLYGSIAFILLAITFHFSPWTIRQTQTVSRWMLIAGTILAVLAVVMVLMTIRKNTPRLRQLDNLEEKLKGYSAHISNVYTGSATIILIETALIVLMSDTSLLMITILLVLILFLSYPNMYKMKNDLGLRDEIAVRLRLYCRHPRRPTRFGYRRRPSGTRQRAIARRYRQQSRVTL